MTLELVGMQSVYPSMAFVEFSQKFHETMTGDWQPFIDFLIRFAALVVIGLCVFLIFTILSETSSEDKGENTLTLLLSFIVIFIAIFVFIFPPIIILAFGILIFIPFIPCLWSA